MTTEINEVARLRAEIDAVHRREALALEYGQRVQTALAANAIIGTWNWHPLRDRFTVDENFAHSFGVDPNLVHQDLTLDQVLATVHPEDRPGLDEAIEATVARGGAYAHQYRVRRADGVYHWIEANGRVDFGPDGQPNSFPGILIDVEAKRSLEEERD
ncbi:PAS domain-containing protein, partial [Lichenihabitans sp. Uapishka_5]|uniref:PAS domain-containing protein n=1 Tax=Lichenihabitans sp. Uapishka_5 TaxID=3037302 RepID=UPI0029E7E5EE